ncbi:MAG: FUSC family protein [Acidobacteriota bacterium]|nr:FUSC family protein [Acidobacteriota bacterium]
MTETTRTALRAAVAALLAILVSAVITAQRPYWTILVAVVVVNDTWGSSLRKTWHRVGMTVAGCVAGWMLHFVSIGRPELEMALLLLSIFLAAFFRKSSYPWMTFFITVYVAFLFTVLGQWSASLMLVRAEDTVLGGVIAIASSFIVPPPRVARRLEEELLGFWQSCREHVEQGFDALSGMPTAYDWRATRRDLLIRVEQLQARAEESLYEQLLQVRSRQRNQRIVRSTVLLCHESLGFGRAAQSQAGPFPEIEQHRGRTLRRFDLLTSGDRTVELPQGAVWRRDQSEAFLYFGRRIDELLAEIYRAF